MSQDTILSLITDAERVKMKKYAYGQSNKADIKTAVPYLNSMERLQIAKDYI